MKKAVFGTALIIIFFVFSIADFARSDDLFLKLGRIASAGEMQPEDTNIINAFVAKYGGNYVYTNFYTNSDGSAASNLFCIIDLFSFFPSYKTFDILPEVQYLDSIGAKRKWDIDYFFVNACQRGYLDLIEYYLKKGANINFVYTNGNWTGFQVAVQSYNYNPEVITYLYRHGADIHVLPKDKYTFDMILDKVYRHGDYTNLIYLIKHGYRSQSIEDDITGTHWYTNLYSKTELDDILKYIHASNKEIRFSDIKNEAMRELSAIGAWFSDQFPKILNIIRIIVFVLTLASLVYFVGLNLINMILTGYFRKKDICDYVIKGDKKRVLKCLGRGADVNAENKLGYTPLSLAAYKGDSGILKILINSGAKVNKKTGFDIDALMGKAFACYTATVWTLIESGNDNFESISDYEAYRCMKFTSRGKAEGVTALMTASYAGIFRDNYEVMKEMLNAGADPDIRDAEGCSALMFACLYRHVKQVRLLIEKGADVNAKSFKKFTPLIVASVHGFAEIVGLLLEAGADINTKTDEGMTAADFARKNNHKNVLDILEKK